MHSYTVKGWKINILGASVRAVEIESPDRLTFAGVMLQGRGVFSGAPACTPPAVLAELRALSHELTRATGKWEYYKIIQGNYGYGWDDEDFHAVDSRGQFRTREALESFRFNLRAYRENGSGQYRVIFRREANPEYKPQAAAIVEG